MGYSERRAYSDTFVPTVKAILARHFKVSVDDVRTAPAYDDCKLATDFFARGRRIAYRVRSKEYRRYMGEFTVRTSGDVPELAKLSSVGVDYFFYGFEALDGTLGEWIIMHVTPEMFAYPVADQTNGTDAYFRAFKVNRESVVGCGRGGPNTQDDDASNN